MDKDIEKLLDEVGELVIDGRLVVRARPARPPKQVRKVEPEALDEDKEVDDGE